MGPSSSAQVPAMPGSFQLQSLSFPIQVSFFGLATEAWLTPLNQWTLHLQTRSMMCRAQLRPTLCWPRLLCPWFSRQEFWSGLPFPPPGELPDPGIEPESPALQADSLPSELWGKSQTRSTRSSNIGCPLLGGRPSRDFRPCKYPRH